MRVRVASLALAILTVVAVAPARAQLRASRPPTPTRNLPRLLVANPHSFAAADSAASVRVGAGMRDKMESVSDKWYTTILRTQMNDALVQYGYPPDAVLPPLVARQLGTQLQARAIVVGSINREGGKVIVEARLLAGNDQSGQMISMSQATGQSFEDLGGKIAESLKGAFNALPDAKQCEALAAKEPAKAIEAANKALKSQPNDAVAELCLAQIAIAQKAKPDEVLAHFKNATVGDRLSLEAWGGLLGQYQAKNDTANIVDTYKQLILVAPNNQKVVEEAARFFIIAGKPDLGEQIARDAITRDPSNPDMYNMLATACLVQDKAEKNKCAIDAMEQVFTLDTAKVDTFNLAKIMFVAWRDSVANAAVHLKWAQAAVKKFPTNASLLNELVKSYGLNGPTDSLVSVAKRMVELDKTDYGPLIRAVRALLKDKRYQDALQLGTTIEQGGQDNDKTNLGIILAQEGGIPVLQTQPVDFPLAMEIGKRASALLKPGSRGHQLASYVLGFGMLGQVQAKDGDVVTSKSCDAVTVLETWVNDTKAALAAGQSIQQDVVAARIKALEDSYPPRIAQMRKAYCKGK